MANIIEDKNISILINHKTSPINDSNWLFMKERYKALMPGAEICVGSYPKGHYSKSAAINNSAKNARGDIFIIADSNIAFNAECIKKGIDGLDQYPLIIPFGSLIYIDERSTKKLHRTAPSLKINNNYFSAYKRQPMAVGHIFIVPRTYFEAIGGFDESITEWDEENIDFVGRLSSEFGDFNRLKEYSAWSLYYERIHYPLYIKGINVERIFETKYPVGDMSWDIRV